MLRSGGLPEAVFNLAMDPLTVQLYFSEPLLAGRLPKPSISLGNLKDFPGV